MKNREGYIVTKTLRECTKCGSMFKNTSKTVTLCTICNSSRVKNESQEVRMYRRAKARAKARDILFTISRFAVWINNTFPVSTND